MVSLHLFPGPYHGRSISRKRVGESFTRTREMHKCTMKRSNFCALEGEECPCLADEENADQLTIYQTAIPPCLRQDRTPHSFHNELEVVVLV